VSLLIVETLAANVVFVGVALALGEPLLRLAGRVAGDGSPRPPSLVRAGAAVLVGLGACAYVGLLLAALRIFYAGVLVALAAVVLLLGRRTLVAYARSLRGTTPATFGVVALGACLVVAQWLVALAPPEATDEIAYHLPEARSIADTHALPLMLGSDRIYGNLPALAETLYAEALSIEGAALAHALHLTLLVAFVLLAAGVARRLFGGPAAVVAALGLLLYQELLYNATTAYVDAAATAFEAGSVLLLVLWVMRRDPVDAAAAAVLLGLAASIKYTTLATAVFEAGVVAVVAVRERRAGFALRLAGLALAACVFWYGKNLLRLGNPVFPFALGHRGVSDATYTYFLDSVRTFGRRTVRAFLEVPWRFATDGEAVAFVAFYLAPLSLVARVPRAAAGLLLAYAALYTTYWFWLASHQTRFLLSAVAVAIVLAAAAVTRARGAAGLAAVAVVAVAAIAVAQAREASFAAGDVPDALAAWFGNPKARYALGLDSRTAYLTRYFGCEVDAVNLLAARRLRGAVGLDELSPPAYFATANRFEPLHVTATTPTAARAQLRRDGFRFALARDEPVTQLSSNAAAGPLLAAARPFWQRDGCTLYRLPL
jgi:hypothetical protein